MSAEDAVLLHPAVVHAYSRYLRTWFGGDEPRRDSIVLEGLFRLAGLGADLTSVDLFELWKTAGRAV